MNRSGKQDQQSSRPGLIDRMRNRSASRVLGILAPTPEEPDSIQKMAFWRADDERQPQPAES